MECYGREVTHNGPFTHLAHLRAPSWSEPCLGRVRDPDRVLSPQSQIEKLSREKSPSPRQRIWGLLYGRSSLATQCGYRWMVRRELGRDAQQTVPLGAPGPPQTACLGDSSLSQLKGMCFGVQQTGFKSQLLCFLAV